MLPDGYEDYAMRINFIRLEKRKYVGGYCSFIIFSFEKICDVKL